MKRRIWLVALVGRIDDPKRRFCRAATNHDPGKLQSCFEVFGIKFNNTAQVQEKRLRFCALVDSSERFPNFDLIAFVFDSLQKIFARGEIIALLNKRNATLIVLLRVLFGRTTSRQEKYWRGGNHATDMTKPLIHF